MLELQTDLKNGPAEIIRPAKEEVSAAVLSIISARWTELPVVSLYLLILCMIPYTGRVALRERHLVCVCDAALDSCLAIGAIKVRMGSELLVQGSSCVKQD